MRTIRLSDKCIEAEYLNYKLYSKGLRINQTDIFDTTTYNAVIKYQKTNRLTTDGVVGNKTWHVFGIDKGVTIDGKVKRIVVHCTATPEDRNVQYKDVYKWHVVGNGWSDIAYGILIGLNKTWYNRSKQISKPDLAFYDPYILSTERTFGTYGKNRNTIDICYVGGMNKTYSKAKNTLNMYQKSMLQSELTKFIECNPDVMVYGHYAFSNRACPSFDVPTVLGELNINSNNIHIK